ALVWALLSDTNRFDRAMGFTLPVYAWREIAGHREHVGRARQNGLTVEWIEPPYQWIEGRMLLSHRDFILGPVRQGGMRLTVVPEGDGARAKMTVYGDSPHWWMGIVAPLVRRRLRKQTGAFMDAMGEVLSRSPLPAIEGPPVLLAQPLLEPERPIESSSGRRTPVDTGELDRRAQRLREAGVDATSAAKLIELLADRPDEEVAQIQPFVRARQWGLDRRTVLRTFLHATRAGLLELEWQVNCPVCRVAAAVVPTLAELDRRVHCDACNIRYDIDFGASVEAVFRTHPALRDVKPAVFCAASPSLRPHVLVQLAVAPGERREHELDLRDGHLHLRTLTGHRPRPLALDEVPARLVVEIDEHEVTAVPEGRAADGGTVLVLANASREPVHVVVERGAWSADAVLGAAIASFPDFVELFATEAPAAGLDLTIGRLAFLFSDLTGSTALYGRIGDARAYAVVQDHFRRMESIIAAHEGAVVKTMGDAVMATFARLDRAMAAAVDVVEQGAKDHELHGIGVKLGVHEGPCLAVRANDRLDFFGTTVNLAARLQAQARSGEIVVLKDLAADPAVRSIVGDREIRCARVALKGITGEQDLVAFQLACAGAEPGQRASGG
ncbi:MAG TPA: adenylate/guanylate cyclase domain-containing protein, partial [Nannocystaceae bacterium]|nr:adenylate/guanylate cyclase domain-containing protein [Nannocystaceae bacterium]